ncbi:NAD(P)-binding domain-containing protein [Tenacibaculum amylolyticum]|uniref:NAD(P)-binding domain-containing protein n=1 Tax=Tenacibaculum amylolyticum TaxID=104269 RepID=UPI003896402A
MTTVINLETITSIVKDIDVVTAMEQGFIAYSNNQTVVPPVGELLFEKPKGDAHIKYGYIKDNAYYVIKIASGFYENAKLGIPSSQGLMLVFDQKTGVPKCVLLDEGFLTDIRTAAAGALAAKYFAPKNVKGIGIIGTGIQARLQLEYLLQQTSCKEIWVWGRNTENAKAFAKNFSNDIHIHIAQTTQEVAQHTNLIVTTTPAEAPLLKAEDIQPGTHITAVGSDTHLKQELDSLILKKAAIVVADSLPQSKSRGEIFRAVQNDAITEDTVIELGNAIQNKALQRTNDEQITVVDLTGVAVQDIMIATAVYNTYLQTK